MFGLKAGVVANAGEAIEVQLESRIDAMGDETKEEPVALFSSTALRIPLDGLPSLHHLPMGSHLPALCSDHLPPDSLPTLQSMDKILSISIFISTNGSILRSDLS